MVSVIKKHSASNDTFISMIIDGLTFIMVTVFNKYYYNMVHGVTEPFMILFATHKYKLAVTFSAICALCALTNGWLYKIQLQFIDMFSKKIHWKIERIRLIRDVRRVLIWSSNFILAQKQKGLVMSQQSILFQLPRFTVNLMGNTLGPFI